MKIKYIIPLIFGTTYLIYKKFYELDFKDLDLFYSQQREILNRKESPPLFTNPSVDNSKNNSKSLEDKIDWELIIG